MMFVGYGVALGMLGLAYNYPEGCLLVVILLSARAVLR